MKHFNLETIDLIFPEDIISSLVNPLEKLISILPEKEPFDINFSYEEKFCSALERFLIEIKEPSINYLHYLKNNNVYDLLYKKISFLKCPNVWGEIQQVMDSLPQSSGRPSVNERGEITGDFFYCIAWGSWLARMTLLLREFKKNLESYHPHTTRYSRMIKDLEVFLNEMNNDHENCEGRLMYD